MSKIALIWTVSDGFKGINPRHTISMAPEDFEPELTDKEMCVKLRNIMQHDFDRKIYPSSYNMDAVIGAIRHFQEVTQE